MSTTKRLGIIAITALTLIAIGFVKANIIAQDSKSTNSNFIAEYMVGYSMPIVIMGGVVFACCLYILREPRTYRV